jgi:uncharacterized protein (DUF1800 family)
MGCHGLERYAARRNRQDKRWVHLMRITPALVVAIVSLMVALDGAAPGVPHDKAAVTHTLNRLAFGPRAGDVAQVMEMGLSRWIEQQLDPARIADGALDSRLARLETLTLDSATIGRMFFQARQQRRAPQRAASDDSAMAPNPPPTPRPMNPAMMEERRIFNELAEAKLLRAVYSERQLEEVLVDFWFNHFNVFARKGQTGIYVGEYERGAIRPHVLGRFRDMLGATARHPAMLFYLDNWQSVAPNRRLAGRLTQAPSNRPERGLNENYARELLELHTLGVDGGYTQDDIVQVARALTGWTIARPGEGGFRFAPNLHDREAKTVLGQKIPAGGGVEDGERVLDILARHPATARNIAFKLTQRFVSDTPPQALVDRAATVFQSSGGDLREVVRTIVTSAEFFDPAVRLAKVKTPFEFVASALRATAADVRTGQAITRALGEMGMPLYMCQPPTGYDDTAAAWVSSGALVSRINFAVALTGGQLRGLQLPAGTPRDALALGAADFQKQ